MKLAQSTSITIRLIVYFDDEYYYESCMKLERTQKSGRVILFFPLTLSLSLRLEIKIFNSHSRRPRLYSRGLEIYIIIVRNIYIFTYQHGTLLHIRRIVMRIVNRNSCHSKSYRPLSQIACQRVKHDTYCTRNKPHANVCLYNSNPVVE